jgi:hypothetical protein
MPGEETRVGNPAKRDTDVAALVAAVAAPSEESASGARSRVSTGCSGRDAGAGTPTPDIALITAPGYLPA